jgi:peroxiredoxin (alkyl hydroperoxide reductase subunit C)
MASVEVGQEAPDFTLQDQDAQDVTLSSFRGQRNVVINFYPFAFSEGCTIQFTRIGADAGRYAGRDAQVLGISVDHRHAQRAFAESLGIDDDRVRLLADFEPKGEIARLYGVYLPWGFANRATFVIDKRGVVRSVTEVQELLDVPDEEAYFATLAACSR